MTNGEILGKKAKDGSIKPNEKGKKNLFSSMMFYLATKEVHYNLIK
jgi:hypothetical protein